MALFNAFIFDMNGTMVDDMHYHLRAWHRFLNEDMKKNMSLEEVRSHMYGKNEELLDRLFGKGHITKAQSDELVLVKEKRYQDEFRPHLQLIAGLPAFLEKTKAQNIQMAIGSAAPPTNIDFVLDGLSIRHYFKAVVHAEDVVLSKPHPETFLKAAELLGVSPDKCLVFEDAPKGVEAAQRAGMKSIVLTTMHSKEEFRDYTNILHYIADYTDPSLNELFI